MRIIKFRGNDNNGNWYYGSLIQYKSGEAAIANFERYGYECSDMSRIKVDPKTVGLFTGLVDKNGKEIYEGDIIRHKDMVKPYHVIYDGNQFTPNDGFRSLSYPKHWVVVGNIHDNPELIKKGGVL